MKVSIDEFISGLSAIPEAGFSVGSVYDYLKSHQVDEETLEPYLFFSPKHYTRNLIFKNDLFELMTLCWEVGQASNIHNHWGQNCWMAVPSGKLRVQNLRVIELAASIGRCQLEPAEAFDIHPLSPAEVDPASRCTRYSIHPNSTSER